MEAESFKIANRYAASLILKGHIVYSSISHSHPIAEEYNLTKNWDFWKKQDQEFIKWCDKIYIIKLNGEWKKSKGVRAEIKLAKKYGKKVVFI